MNLELAELAAAALLALRPPEAPPIQSTLTTDHHHLVLTESRSLPRLVDKNGDAFLVQIPEPPPVGTENILDPELKIHWSMPNTESRDSAEPPYLITRLFGRIDQGDWPMEVENLYAEAETPYQTNISISLSRGSGNSPIEDQINRLLQNQASLEDFRQIASYFIPSVADDPGQRWQFQEINLPGVEQPLVSMVTGKDLLDGRLLLVGIIDNGSLDVSTMQVPTFEDLFNHSPK